jgi:hypothetical protein
MMSFTTCSKLAELTAKMLNRYFALL